MRVELNKDLVGHDPPLDVINLVSKLKGSFLELDGGVGVVSEYLSKLGNEVTLQDSNRLSFSYRKTRVPDSKVKCWPIDLSHVKLNKPVFDYVIFSNSNQRVLALSMSKIGAVDLTSKEVVLKDNHDVVRRPEKFMPVSETDRVNKTDEGAKSVILHSGESPTSNKDSFILPDPQSVVHME